MILSLTRSNHRAQGKGVPVDYKVSFDYYLAAHNAGFAKGHFALGTAYVIYRSDIPIASFKHFYLSVP
jgi:hypothetical protein